MQQAGIDRTYILIEVADLLDDIEYQCLVMNYFVDYTNNALTQKLVTASRENRREVFQDILDFENRLKGYQK